MFFRIASQLWTGSALVCALIYFSYPHILYYVGLCDRVCPQLAPMLRLLRLILFLFLLVVPVLVLVLSLRSLVGACLVVMRMLRGKELMARLGSAAAAVVGKAVLLCRPWEEHCISSG